MSSARAHVYGRLSRCRSANAHNLCNEPAVQSHAVGQSCVRCKPLHAIYAYLGMVACTGNVGASKIVGSVWSFDRQLLCPPFEALCSLDANALAPVYNCQVRAQLIELTVACMHAVHSQLFHCQLLCLQWVCSHCPCPCSRLPGKNIIAMQPRSMSINLCLNQFAFPRVLPCHFLNPALSCCSDVILP